MTTIAADPYVPTFVLNDVDATETLARVLAQTAPSPAVVFLHGDLGAGKSTFARAWLRVLGVQGAIRSPTYTLVERYPLQVHENERQRVRDEATSAPYEALHLDLYRIGDAGELEFLGLDDARAVLWLVEWPERGEGWLPSPDLRIRLAMPGDGTDGRHCRISADTKVGRVWCESAVNALSDTGLRPVPEA
jgi:tRNA threonylcarbamoyladenosine biosynthesis protein TsaE